MANQIEIERKYVIKMPDLDLIEKIEGYSVSRIVQIYLESEKGVTHRVRKRTFSDREIYTETKKIRIDSVSAHEDENEISAARFAELSAKMKAGTRPVIKSRHTFPFCGVTIEIDVYPDWKRSAIMETELGSRDQDVAFPDFLEIVSEVSGDGRYSNAAMAQRFPDELI